MIKKLKQERFLLMIVVVLSLLLHLLYGIGTANEFMAYELQVNKLEAQLQDKQEQIEVLEIILENKEQDASETEEISLGEFTVTHYCPCEICCGKSNGITFTGTQATEGRTIAVDPAVIPLGSTVIIDGQEYVAEDIGGAIKGNRLDVFMDSHQAALQAGVVQAEIYVIGGNDEEA